MAIYFCTATGIERLNISTSTITLPRTHFGLKFLTMLFEQSVVHMIPDPFCVLVVYFSNKNKEDYNAQGFYYPITTIYNSELSANVIMGVNCYIFTSVL